jgi:hypothetical protein
LKAVATIGGKTGAPDFVGEEGVAKEVFVETVPGEETEFKSLSDEVSSWVVTFFSEGKKVLMTGRDKRPTRPSWTALDVVLAGEVWDGLG